MHCLTDVLVQEWRYSTPKHKSSMSNVASNSSHGTIRRLSQFFLNVVDDCLIVFWRNGIRHYSPLHGCFKQHLSQLHELKSGWVVTFECIRLVVK